MENNSGDNSLTGKLVNRNILLLEEVFNTDPSRILISVQIKEDQEKRLNSGLQAGVSRRLVPLTVVAELIARLNNNK